MRTPRVLTASLTLLGLIGLSAGAQQEGEGTAPRSLDNDLVAIRLLLGIGDDRVQTWDGRVRIDKGEVLGVEGCRFRKDDRVAGKDSWKARSLLTRKAAAQPKGAAKGTLPKTAEKSKGPGNTGPRVSPNGVLITARAPADATLNVETAQGNFEVALAELADGSILRPLSGRVEAQRVPPSVPVATGPDEQDFPAAAVDGQGVAWLAYVVHSPRGPRVSEALQAAPEDFARFAPTDGGDQIRLARWSDGRAGNPIEVTAAGLDVWRPAVAVAGDGSVVVAWSENVEGNWDLYERRYDPARSQWSEPRRLTTNPGTDADVVLATAPGGKVWMAWQAWNKGQADILLAPINDPSSPVTVSESAANDWSPALAIDQAGRIHVAYDTYQQGNYDVMLRTRSADGKLGPTLIVAGTSKFEARPSLATDSRGRVWIAYEERTSHWGKDAENLVDGRGSSLYRESAVRVRCVDGGRIFDAPDPLAQAPRDVRPLNSFPRLVLDRAGRVWLAFRHRQEAIWGGNAAMVVGGVWVEYVTALGQGGWSIPQVLPTSDGLLDNRPALVSPTDGPVLAFYNTDARLRHEVEMTPELNRRFYTHSGTPDGVVDNDIQAAALTPAAPDAPGQPKLNEVPSRPADPPEPAVHPNEPADISRMRQYRIAVEGTTYRLLRGEFHRHTEISQDGGSDGALEDMWRYACDVAALEWIGNGDHDNGGGKEYTWWLVQKTTDLYHNPPGLTPMFTYERSVAYPHGHRNVMWARRGVRTLPRLVDDKGVVDADTPMLYAYLKEHGGICASHTSATGMGTDWRDVNAELEPFVEIFQGHRNSYEHLGAPRVARRSSDAIGGWRPLGMVWNALALQYKIGFQASSDHISTHISYAVAIAEDHTRAAILDAFRRRHCYAATDNIVLDVRSAGHLMGDEFTTDRPVSLRVVAHGTQPIERVDIIKDFVYVYSTEPHKPRVEFRWTDDERRPAGLSWYYVRVIQEDGEIAWGSPFWIHQMKGTEK